MIEAFAERAIQAEQLGKHDVIDLLAVSFSSNDYVGHALGPDSPEVHEISVATDKLLAQILRLHRRQRGHAERAVRDDRRPRRGSGSGSQHARAKCPAGACPASSSPIPCRQALTAKFGEGKWIVSPSEHSLYLNLDLIDRRNWIRRK